MERLTETAHRHLLSRLQPGDVAIDATAGNGHDTVFLAKVVGPAGFVYAFDVQADAISHTRQRLTEEGLSQVQLFQCDHTEMAERIAPAHRGQVAAAMFNLGYLPGSDKSTITQAATTGKALATALGVLRVGGTLTLIAYPGHPGGVEELLEVDRQLAALDASEFTVERVTPESPQAPRLFVAIRQGTSLET